MVKEPLKENDINEMILNMIEEKKKKVLPKKKHRKDIKKDSLDKDQIKNNLDTFFKEQEQVYKNEEINLIDSIQTEIKDKEKELNDYYLYCQDFKKKYKNNFNEIIKHSEEIKKDLKDIHIEYLDNKILLENKRKMELESMSNFYKEKLLEVKRQWDNKTFCDENLKNIVYDILNVIN